MRVENSTLSKIPRGILLININDLVAIVKQYKKIAILLSTAHSYISTSTALSKHSVNIELEIGNNVKV